MHNNNTIMKPYLNNAQYALSLVISIFGILFLICTYGWKEEDINILLWFIGQVIGYATLFAVAAAMLGTVERLTKHN